MSDTRYLTLKQFYQKLVKLNDKLLSDKFFDSHNLLLKQEFLDIRRDFLSLLEASRIRPKNNFKTFANSRVQKNSSKNSQNTIKLDQDKRIDLINNFMKGIESSRPSDIFRTIQSQNISINQRTFYRDLTKLIKSGKIKLENGKLRQT
ncbi:MAG: hypothetical protein HYW77_00495 [Parcubacteria group bacterium]|nr:hypothetical protein [Parcubacteria group bacterium]